ncbi:hypothetical protein IW261DRAFT_1481652 [Armillaria novae-zelandiae]|uniref:Uncharacterized protein n=1 Tax=Armillaria novae-zelandiae TaxID=153914 RepID=A0AA39P877_9AGAR|nr:hypothetical protein IW261DRAFT_1481652 [Armillaria novae-zelandiae]
MTMLANTVRGLSQKHYRQLYIACICPVLTLRKVVAAFRTTPIEASTPPIRLYLDQCTRRAAIRFNKLSTGNPIIQQLDNRWRAGRNPSNPPPLPTHKASRAVAETKKTTQLQQVAMLTDPNDERLHPFSDLAAPWRRTEQDRDIQRLQTCDHLLVYTDGSQRDIRGKNRRSRNCGIQRRDTHL